MHYPMQFAPPHLMYTIHGHINYVYLKRMHSFLLNNINGVIAVRIECN